MSVTSKLNLYFRISIFCDTILCTGLDASVYFDVILLTLIRPSSSINTWAKRLWHAIATIMLALSIGATTDFPCSFFNSSAIVLFLSFNAFSLFCCCYFGWETTYLFITASLYWENNDRLTPFLSHEDGIHSFTPEIMFPLAFYNSVFTLLWPLEKTLHNLLLSIILKLPVIIMILIVK